MLKVVYPVSDELRTAQAVLERFKAEYPDPSLTITVTKTATEFIVTAINCGEDPRGE